MKLSSIILASTLAFSTYANASNPVVEAECAAVFKAVAITIEQNSPELAAKATNISNRLRARSSSVIGSSASSRYYILKMDNMTAELRVNSGTRLFENDTKFCINLAKSYGMM